jgi:hypothetical protein
VHPPIKAVFSFMEELINQFKDVLRPEGALEHTAVDVVHFLETRSLSGSAKFRQLDPEKMAGAKNEFFAMEAAGVVRHSNSPWVAPLHLVRKQDGSWLPCGNYKRLSTVTVPAS